MQNTYLSGGINIEVVIATKLRTHTRSLDLKSNFHSDIY